MTSGAGRALDWTSFNQVRKITQGAVNTAFWFGASHERVIQKHSDGTTTHYVGALFEKVTGPGNFVEEKNYIYTPLGRTAVRTVRSDLKVETRYFHQDALGSIYAVTDELGRVEKRFTYDPWGKRINTRDEHTGSGGKVTRGYTDHEHLADFGLIHMNGRVFDPVLGRFLSADPFVQGADDSQAYNRYSYCSNDPINHSDPSGYFTLRQALPVIIAVIVAIVVTYYCPPAGPEMWSMVGKVTLGQVVAGAAAGGFASAFSASMLNGGSIGDAFKAGVTGAVVSAATALASYGIGKFFGPTTSSPWNWTGRTLAHATVGGLASEAQGGEFRHGFYSSGASAGIMHIPAVQTLMGGTEGGWYIAGRTATAALIGGTVSEIGGGKFANGAWTSTIQHLFNEEVSKSTAAEAAKKVITEAEAKMKIRILYLKTGDGISDLKTNTAVNLAIAIIIKNGDYDFSENDYDFHSFDSIRDLRKYANEHTTANQFVQVIVHGRRDSETLEFLHEVKINGTSMSEKSFIKNMKAIKNVDAYIYCGQSDGLDKLSNDLIDSLLAPYAKKK